MPLVGDDGSVFQISRHNLKKYPPLTKEKEWSVSQTIQEQKQMMLRYLARFPHFLTFLARLREWLDTKSIHPHEVFHLNTSGNSSALEKRHVSDALLLLDEIELLRREWIGARKNRSGLDRNGAAEKLVARYGDRILTLIERASFTQDFINSYIDKLPREWSTTDSMSILPRLPARLNKTILKNIRNARSLHLQAVDMLIQSNLRLVIKIARNYLNAGISFSDILQEGNLGLIKAVDRYDHTRGTRFSTYATWWIKQSINRAIVHRNRIIRFPIHLSEKLKRLQREIDLVHQNEGREMTWVELADLLGYPEETFLLLLTSQQRILSLDPIPDDNEEMLKLQDVLPDQSTPHPINEICKERLKKEIGCLLKTLSNREQTVLQLRYGINVERRFTLEEVGSRLGVTRERIRQIEIRAIDKLKHPSRSEQLVKFLF
ncbi:sigma-70 family RNA polymerase sigma factor [bacterium]|nr:sigma-70 family RNA polymerase sigma factor [bacterium]